MDFADVVMVVVVTTLAMMGILWPWFEDTVDNSFDEDYK